MVMVYNAPDSPELFGQVARHADLAQAGVDLYKISRLLEHKDIKVTQRYASHCPDSLRDGVEILQVDYNWQKGVFKYLVNIGVCYMASTP